MQPSVKASTFEVSIQPAYQKFGKLTLSEYGFFSGVLSQLLPADNVLPYDINSPLFSDYALKKRFIYLPEGRTIQLGDDILEFPVGAVLIKNFYYEDSQLAGQKGRIVETRLLIREEGGWKALPYIWNADQTEAYLEIAGENFPFQLINARDPVSYSIPTVSECKSCHEKNGAIMPIGPSVRQLNRKNTFEGKMVNQLEYFRNKGWITEGVNPATMKSLVNYEDGTAPVELRARAYLDVNCAHCHRPEGPAKTSGLNLRFDNEDAYSLGIHKPPVAAGKGSGGLFYDIVPGKPEESILIYRMNSTDPAVMMPEIGRHLIHREGLELVRRWIIAMD